MAKSNKKAREASEREKIIETLYSEIQRKDKIIDKLQEENSLLMKTALKAAERQRIAEERLRKSVG